MPAGEPHTRLKAIFCEALEREGAERAAYLGAACAGDQSMRNRVEALLAGAEKDDAFLSEATMDAPGVHRPEASVEHRGERIGQYKLLQLIGEGGFGSVFMAEQESPVRRRVALKIIKLGMDTRAVVARFEQERQALAVMDHPNIAKVLDAGATERGRPYFVMELVKGDPITRFCDRENLSIPERLELFMQVCRAVQHAHTKGIVHRDLKPTNILVSVQDGRPQARVIDFGIAKATDHRLTEKTVFTELRQLIGTPEYMSPEQAEGSLDIDTRTDVYSLGVLLYELLTGSTPFDPRRLRSAAYAELQRIIREDDPPRPSTRLSQATENLPGVAARRRTEPRKLGTLIRGELDWIVMRALEKDRSRRYETASGLEADVQRYLAGEAVLAAPPGKIYRARKFVRKHRVAVIAGSLVALAVVGGLGVASYGYMTATRAWNSESEARRGEVTERRKAEAAQSSAETNERIAKEQAARAEREVARTRAVNDFLQTLLGGVAPSEAGEHRDVTVRELIDRSAKQIDDGSLAREPELAATVLGTIGGLYWQLGDYPRAEKYLNKAIELSAGAGLPGRDIAILRDHLGHVLRDRSDLDGAESSYRKALADALGDGGGPSESIGSIYNSLAGIAMARSRLEEARDLYAKAMDQFDRAGVASHNEVLKVYVNKAVLANRLGDDIESERLLRMVLERARAAAHPDQPILADATINLAVLLAKHKRFEEAIAMARRSVAICRAIYAPGHRTTLDSLTQLAAMLLTNGEWAEAERLYTEVIAGLRDSSPGDTAIIYEPMRGYTSAVEQLGRPAEAEATRREMLGIARRGLGRAEIATALANLGRNLTMQKKWEDAEPVLREALSMRRGLIDPTSSQGWMIATTESALGETLVAQAERSVQTDPAAAANRLAEAEPLIIGPAESLPRDSRVPSPARGGADRKRPALERAVGLYTTWERLGTDPERSQKLESWRRALAEYDAANPVIKPP